MFNTIFLTLSLISTIVLNEPVQPELNGRLLAVREISLENRQPDQWANSVFKDNILLAMAYLKEEIRNSKDVNWDKVRQPFKYVITLKPGEVFAFHDDLLPQYRGKVTKTTNAHFNSYEGFKSDGWLVGDGVCHLASIINWVAKEAELDVLSPTYHDFARIEGIPREFGVSIYSNPNTPGANARQNMYIRNNLENNVIFDFEYNGKVLKVSVFEDIEK